MIDSIINVLFWIMIVMSVATVYLSVGAILADRLANEFTSREHLIFRSISMHMWYFVQLHAAALIILGVFVLFLQS